MGVFLRIVDAKRHSLKDNVLWMLAEIETHPKVQESDIDIHTKDKDRMYKLFKRFLENLPSDKNQIFLVGQLGETVVGFLGIHRKSKRMKHVGVVGITIHPDYWQRGFGTELLMYGVEYARKEGFLRLEADTLAKNKAMVRVAEKLGFTVEGIRKMRIQRNKKFEDEVLLGMLM
jgi:RimJ/RimL family protein N-acetyltransferase